MKDVDCTPYAPVLLESMRAIGYSLDTAIADLVDNCISANARNISIHLPPGKPDHLGILDDGNGMTADQLRDAMRHGSRNPNDKRQENDLGRFGLGLKTASLSQCRRLTVVSKKEGAIEAVAWDLDHVIKTENWSLQVLDTDDLAKLPLVRELKSKKSGTLVLWQKLDRAALDDDNGSLLSERLDQTRRHLALVFHRYLDIRAEGHISIEINGLALAPVDPFLALHPSTIKQNPEPERITVHRSTVLVQAFTLPHISQLTQEEINKAGGREDLRREQGFYIYRNRRLIVWGTWFHLAKQEELSKLTRVMVDVTNELDDKWSLDIKKSTAVPPELLKKRLRELVPHMCRPSRQVHHYRGRAASTIAKVTTVWNRVENRNGTISYQLSREHPAIAAIMKTVDETSSRALREVLQLVEESFPGEAFYNDRAQERFGHRTAEKLSPREKEHLEQLAMNLLDAAGSAAGRKSLLSMLHAIEPFDRHPEFTNRLQDRLSK